MLFLCLLLMVAGLTLGGGTAAGLPGDVVVQTVAAGLALACLARWMTGEAARISRLEVVLLAFTPVLAAVQLLPLPPALWSALPPGDMRMTPFLATATEPGLRPLSLAPDATAQAAMAVLPATVLFVALRMVSRGGQRLVLLAALATIAASLFLGLAQLAGGRESALRFFAVTNADDPVGFFANRNHFAASLAAGLLLAAPFLTESGLAVLEGIGRRRRVAGPLVAFLATAVFMLLMATMIVLTRSRAGLAMAGLAVAGIALLMLLRAGRRWRRAGAGALIALFGAAALLATQAGWLRLLDRLDGGGADGRLVIARNTLRAVADFFPLGAGLGAFRTVYATYEPVGEVMARAYVNAAHNDWLQIVLEAGLPGVAGLALFCGWLAITGRALFSGAGAGLSALELSVRRAAFLALAVLALHGLSDYPLRTDAGLMLFALCAALAGQGGLARQGGSAVPRRGTPAPATLRPRAEILPP